MTERRDKSGLRFGRLMVVRRGDKIGQNHRWLCRCDCGIEKLIYGCSLQTGATTSCGCLRREKLLAASTKHGGNGTPEYEIWKSMIQRCENPRSKDFRFYGGRGIRICASWRASFAAFLADVGDRPSPDLTIDRINNDGNYEPGNCRWATWSQQVSNRRVLA